MQHQAPPEQKPTVPDVHDLIECYDEILGALPTRILRHGSHCSSLDSDVARDDLESRVARSHAISSERRPTSRDDRRCRWRRYGSAASCTAHPYSLPSPPPVRAEDPPVQHALKRSPRAEVPIDRRSISPRVITVRRAAHAPQCGRSAVLDFRGATKAQHPSGIRHLFATEVLRNAQHSALGADDANDGPRTRHGQPFVGSTIDTQLSPARPTSPPPRRHNDHITTITHDHQRRHQPIHHHHEQQPLPHHLTRHHHPDPPNIRTPTPQLQSVHTCTTVLHGVRKLSGVSSDARIRTPPAARSPARVR